MALFKSRNNRRSSSSSYASTLTTVVLITICALGVWMLTSNNQDSPPTRTTTTRTSIDTSSTNNYISSSDDLDETTIKSHDPKDTTRVFGHNDDHLPDDPIKFDDKNVNIHAEHEPLKDQSLISEAQLSEESSLTQKQVASDTNEAGAYNYDKKMSESEKLQRISNTEGSEGNQRDEDENARVQDENPDTKEDKNREYQNVNEGETQELNVGQQQEDVRNLDNQESKNEEDEQKQTREDKGDITEEDQKQQDQQQKQDDNSNSYSDTDTKISTSKDSQLEPHTDSQLESQTDSQQEPHTDSQLESHTDSQLEPHTDSDSQLESHSDAQLETHTDSDSQLESHTDSQLESQTDSQLESHTDSQLEPHIDSQQESHTDSQLESHTALEGESSQLTQQKETQKLELEKKKKKKLKGGDKDANQSKESKSLSKGSKKSWSTQADQSHNEKERQKVEESDSSESLKVYTWQLCNVTAGADYIPCLDNEKALKQLRSTKHYEHRERHCPEDAPACLVPLPKGYKRPIEWPASRDKIWYYNVPHTLLAEVKGHQNWVKVTGEFLTFPGGGTQFIHGALHYIDFIQEAEAGIAWGKRTRVILDVGCGVGSFGGYLFERDVVAMSFAPKDEHIAQVQFALERGIPAISAVMGSQRLPFPSQVFDLVHCARCRVPWHAEGGLLLLELNRVLRPGGYFVWSATPVYQKLEEDVHIWNEMSSLTKSMCWELVTVNKDKLNSVGAAIFRKPNSNECYEQRMENSPPICSDNDDPNAAWYVPLQACLHKVPVDKDERGSRWPEPWPNRLHKAPYWLNDLQAGIYGKPASQDFAADDERWKNVVDEMSNVGITWSNVRNVMDMRAVYGGFAAALRDLPVWVINVVNVDSPDTLPIIFERGLFGIYHDWCESFSTYPRTYDLLHADSLFSKLKKRCKLVPVMAEVDRIVRPGGKLIVRDEEPETLVEVENLLKSLHWEITFSKNQEGLLCAKKGKWRPDSYVAVS